MVEPRPERSQLGRLSAALFGATLVGLLAALLDVTWIRRAESEPPAFGGLLLPEIGLLAALALALGIAVGVAAAFMHPARSPSLSRLARALRSDDEQRRAHWAIGLPLAAVGVAVWIVLSSRIALSGLASEAATGVSGAAIAVGALLVALLLWALVLGVTRAVSGWLGERVPDPLITGAIGLVLAAGLIGFAIATGTTSGAGGTLALFGVFKRPELDLRAPALLLLIALGAYLGPAALRRMPSWALLALALAPLVLVVHAARSLGEAQALAIERSAPLGKIALARFRKLTDRDHDGASALFGGGDCNDRDPAIGPQADDIPGDGLDQDCSGKDAERVELGSRGSEPSKDARQHALSVIPPKLNVVLITVDTLRYDISGMGYARKLCPNIDRLAAKSAVFSHAYAIASYTSKSLAPMLIGKYGTETHRGWSHFNRFEPDDIFVQERLQRAGIRTLSVQGYWYFFNKGYGYERGFDRIDSSAAPKAIQMEGDRTITADKLSDAVIDQLGKPENVDQQFYLWAHYVDPHTEYVEHEGFDFGSSSRDAYDSEVAFVDHEVGRVLDFVAKSKFANNTAIIFTSDHGEAFGEHGMIRHGFEIGEVLVRVPLILPVPGVQERAIDVRRGAIDVVPTILDLFRLPMPPGQGTDFVSGQSLLLDVVQPPGYVPKPRIVFVDMTAGPNNAERQAFIEDGKKLITSGGRPLGLYDVDQDPEEAHNLLAESELKERLLSRYKAFRRELREVVVKPIPK